MEELSDLEALILARDWAEAGIARRIREQLGAPRSLWARECGLSAEAIRAYETYRRRPCGVHGIRYGRLLARYARFGQVAS